MTCIRERCSCTRHKTSSFDTCAVQLIFSILHQIHISKAGICLISSYEISNCDGNFRTRTTLCNWQKFRGELPPFPLYLATVPLRNFAAKTSGTWLAKIVCIVCIVKSALFYCTFSRSVSYARQWHYILCKLVFFCHYPTAQLMFVVRGQPCFGFGAKYIRRKLRIRYIF